MNHPDPFAPAQLGPVTLRNRIIKAATFEGTTAKHVVSKRLIAFHRAVARGGVGMTTVAFSAVSEDGCGTPNEIVLNDDATSGLADLAEAIHAEGAAVSVQLGHAGRGGGRHRPQGTITESHLQSARRCSSRAPSNRHDIARITADFVSAATRVADAGCDAVELHFGHGYLPSEFLSPKLNKRTDEWGGSIENRGRFARQVAEGVRKAVDGRVAVLAKLNMADGVPGGLWLDESVRGGATPRGGRHARRASS